MNKASYVKLSQFSRSQLSLSSQLLALAAYANIHDLCRINKGQEGHGAWPALPGGRWLARGVAALLDCVQLFIWLQK